MFFLLACSSPPVLQGRVVDIWGNPVEDAVVVIEGVVERYRSDAGGLFRIETEAPVVRVMAGKDGYIKDVTEVPTPPEKGDDYGAITLELFPEPEETGFYAIGPKAYIPVDAQRIVMVGTELRHYTGIRDVPATGVSHGNARFVFTSRLRPSELARMNLHLSRLEFVNHTRVKGVLGPMDATVNLFTAKGEVPFDLEQLGSRDDYLITTREPLSSGTYAFHAQDVLNEPDERVFLMLPKEMQIAFPFEVN